MIVALVTMELTKIPCGTPFLIFVNVSFGAIDLYWYLLDHIESFLEHLLINKIDPRGRGFEVGKPFASVMASETRSTDRLVLFDIDGTLTPSRLVRQSKLIETRKKAHRS